MIYVEKIVGGYWVSASPPHTHVDYRSPEALSVAKVIKELTKRGAIQTDIADALRAADPDWISN
jgi:hypothetical protein